MVAIGGYTGFCICDLDEDRTIQQYVDVDAQDAFHHLCKTSIEEWQVATGIGKDEEESFVLDKVFPLLEKRIAQCERQRLEDNEAKERKSAPPETVAADPWRAPEARMW